MRSFSEIETTVKRASKAIGFSWGISEEVGKNIRLLEMFGLPGLKNLNQYYKIYKISNFENINEISSINNPKNYYCPILAGLNFLDQSPSLSKLKEIKINKIAFPVIFISFISRVSEIIGKRIFLKMDDKEFLFNFNESIYSNYLRLKHKDLIGFVGAPWTILIYMLNQKSPKDKDLYHNLKDQKFIEDLLEVIVKFLKIHINNQIESGATIIQIFDSWAGLLKEPLGPIIA